MSDLNQFGADIFGRIRPHDDEPAPEPDVSLVNGRAPADWEADSRRLAVLADRDRCNDVLSGLVRRQP